MIISVRSAVTTMNQSRLQEPKKLHAPLVEQCLLGISELVPKLLPLLFRRTRAVRKIRQGTYTHTGTKPAQEFKVAVSLLPTSKVGFSDL